MSEITRTIRTLTLQECCERMREYGLKIGAEVLREGLEQGVFPFGTVVVPKTPTGADRRPRVFIFAGLLEKWLMERCDFCGDTVPCGSFREGERAL